MTQNTGREGGRRKGDDVERIARAFHGWYESHAYRRGWETQEATRTDFDNLPAENRETMLATVRTLLERRIIAPVSELQALQAERDEWKRKAENLQELATEASVQYQQKKMALRAAQSLYEELKAGVEEEVERRRERAAEHRDEAARCKSVEAGENQLRLGRYVDAEADRLSALLDQKGEDRCPTCNSDNRFVLKDPCGKDSHEPDPWHRHGSDAADKGACETCGGRKWIRLDVPPPAYASRRCPDCKGSGAMQGPEGDTNCPTCEGSGESEKEERKETTVPEPVWILRGRTTGPPGVMESRTTEVVDGPPLRPREGVRVIPLADLRRWAEKQALDAEHWAGRCEEKGPPLKEAMLGWVERAKAFRDLLDHLPALQEGDSRG